MSDSPFIKVQEIPKPFKTQPVYLVLTDRDKKGIDRKFISTKLDEGRQGIKAVGFYSEESIESICENYNELIRQADKSRFVELTIPWHNIIKIQSLIYRHK